jgi:Rieske Fe-S protein
MIRKLSYKIFLSSLLLTLYCSSCNKDNFRFPDVFINLSAGLYNDLANLGVGSYDFFYDEEGVNGLIIFRSYRDEYFVYDRTCTHETDFSCAVERDPDFNNMVECPCCGSRYLLDDSGDALVSNGPAQYPLVRYNASIDGAFLRIYN